METTGEFDWILTEDEASRAHLDVRGPGKDDLSPLLQNPFLKRDNCWFGIRYLVEIIKYPPNKNN